MRMHHVRRGSGKRLLLVPGLGATWQSWDTIAEALAREREVIAIDLPGFGASPPLAGEVSIATLTDAVETFIAEQDLAGIDMVGSSMGARMVLELARRGVGGTAVALDPGGFWSPGQQQLFGFALRTSIKLLRTLQPVLPLLTGNPVTRSLLLAQFSARPWALSSELALRELRGYATAPSFDAALDALIDGPVQQGAPAGSTPGPVVIGWGRNDYVTLPSQAKTATRLFPDAQLHWFDRCGHFPHWDAPEATIQLILDSTA